MWWILYTVVIAAVLLYGVRWFLQPVLEDRIHPHALTYTHTYVVSKPGGKANGTAPFPSIYEPASVYLSLIVPAYNEEERLDIMMKDTIRYLSSRTSPSFTYEIIIVDDGSRDRTSEIAVQNWVQKLGSDVVRVMTFKQNQGKGGAVQQGMLHARGEYLLMVDADGATRIDDLTQLENELKRIQTDNGFGVAVGSRAHLETDAVAKRKWYRNILMYGFHFLVSTLCVSGIRDTQCGFKLFTRKSAQILFANQHLRRWCFDVELLFLARRFSMPIVEVCVNWQEIPGSKIRLIESSLLMGRDLVIIRGSYTTGIWKYSGDVKRWEEMQTEYARKSFKR